MMPSSASGPFIEITDPCAIFLEIGDRLVVATQGTRHVTIIVVALESDRLKWQRRDHYQRYFLQGVTRALAASAEPF